ncbi:MAG TPA: hypothetical protein VHO04_09025 [Sphingopyxis sp.]|uniref:hypothetical protein n=1 Tax=Sphingopyxis sp. TaxID=1908224 RepID=UPI002E333A33|nr:hypothetical protein [Sphingopyxis sp.]HEX2812810.1 hypothetical protein [Sphingopyxis sp.]
MTGADDAAAKRPGAGCLAGGALFAVIFVAIWLAAITLYGLIVEQWELVRVRRGFSYDWAFLYAPLIALGVGLTAAFFATRRLPAARMTLLILTVGLIALFGGILLFGLGGLI